MQNKIEAILNAPRRANVSQVKAFVGIVTYAKFVPNASTIKYSNIFKKNEV